MRSNFWWLFTLCLSLILAACYRTEPTAEPIRAVRTLTVKDQSFAQRHEYAAEVRARTEARLSFRVGGKLIKRRVDLGQNVRAGQVLAELDPEDLRLAQDNARAQLAAARANYDLAEADFKRYRDLREQNFISSAELERREAALKSATALLAQSKAQTQLQTNQAGYSLLISDVAGVVTAVEAEPGAVVSSGSTVLRIAQNGPRDVVFSVPEDKIAQIRDLASSETAFKAQPWGGSSKSLPLHVREIAAAADPVTRTFLVKADLGGAASSLVSLGQTISVVVDPPPALGVVKLPLVALKETNGQSAVWLLNPSTMTVALQPVVVQSTDGHEAVISQGLKAGDVVVTAGVHVLTPGQKVKWFEAPSAGSSANSSSTVVAAPTSTAGANQ